MISSSQSTHLQQSLSESNFKQVGLEVRVPQVLFPNLKDYCCSKYENMRGEEELSRFEKLEKAVKKNH